MKHMEVPVEEIGPGGALEDERRAARGTAQARDAPNTSDPNIPF